MNKADMFCAMMALTCFGSVTSLAQTDGDKPIAVATSPSDEVMTQAADLDASAHELVRSGNAAGALPMFSEALRRRRKVLGERHPDTLTSLHNYADVLQVIGRVDEAEPLFVEALRLRREVLGERHPDTLTSLNSYASVLSALGRPLESEPLSAEALRLRREVLGERHPDTLTSLEEYASALNYLGRIDEAEPLFAEALRLRREILGERHPDTLSSLNSYAYVLSDLGRNDEAEAIYIETLRLRREVLGERHPDTLTSLHNYAYALTVQSRAAEAAPIFSEVLRIRREVLGERHPNTLITLNNYSWALATLGRYDEALLLDAEALRLRRDVLGERHPETIISLSNYAHNLVRLGRADEAVRLNAEALRLRREVFGERHPETIISLDNYAEALFSLGRVGEARPLFAQALRLRREVLGDRHPDTLTSLRINKQLLMRRDTLAEALALSREHISATRQRLSELSGGQLRDRSQRDRELSNRQSVERFHADVLWAAASSNLGDQDALTDEAFTALQFASAGSTNQAVADAAASRFASDIGLQELVQERRNLISEWPVVEAGLIEAQTGAPGMQARREALSLRLGEIEARSKVIEQRLNAEAPQFSSILTPRAVDRNELQPLIGQEEAVLLLVPTNFGIQSMVITNEGLHWMLYNVRKEKIAESVDRLRQGLEIIPGSSSLPEFDLDLAYQLYVELIAPIETALEGKSRVYIVADSVLSRLPLGALITSAPPEDADENDPTVLRNADWLADRYALVQLPSLQSLVYIRKFAGTGKSTQSEEFFGFGAPVLDGNSATRGARSPTLPPLDASIFVRQKGTSTAAPLMDPNALRKLAALPGTRRELEEVSNAISASTSRLFLGPEMTETAIRSADLSQATILHLATHAFTSEEAGNLAEPGLVFTPPPTAQPSDDGYLAASEVVKINLTSARWVILSACNTASPSGRQDETGLSGLAMAFFYSGASSLLVSHWPVFDDIAPVLTVKTLTLAQSGIPRAEALQQAMREVRNNPKLEAEHPAVWAPFTLVGEGR